MALDKMDDSTFLSYVEGHSKTPRHAFHRDDVRRLMTLAGVEEMTVDDCGLPNFLGVDEFEGARLVALARAGLRGKSIAKESEGT